jgi:hypothetical protein
MMKGDESGHRIILQGLGFSSAAFLGETVLFNEMFENRYDLRLFDFADHSLQTIASIDCTPKKLLSLERVHLVIDDERSG